MRCSKCGTNNPTTNNFCAKCGNALGKHCAKCKAENPPTSDFCGKCGAPLGNGAGIAVATSSPPESGSSVRIAPEQTEDVALDGERKTVTALFADIKGSMDLIEDLDPEEARALVDPAIKLMIEAAHRYDGYIVQSTGDGVFALFGAPAAHEDHPQRALYAALRMQEEMRRYGDRMRQQGQAPLQARVGVNTGEVVVRTIKTGEGHTEYTPIGHSTSLASRLQTLATPGSTVISEQTRKFVEGYFSLKPLGPARIKGVSEPVNVFEVTGLGPLRTRLQRSAGRGLTKFVGRRREMDAMKHAAERATGGRGQLVAAMAEAGTGKSRLFFEFKAKNQSGWMVLEAFSVSHGKASAFLPVIDLLWSYFEISSDDDERKRREKINGKILTLDRSLEDGLPYIYGLLGLSDESSQIAEVEAQTRKRRALEAIKRILLRESLNQPLIVIFEDLHWVDEETQAFLNLLADSIGTAKILLLVNYRPEYSHQWNSKTYYTQLRLDPLGKESADEMLSALLGDGAELGPLKRLIIEKTEGNPFFMEETVLVLLDEGALVRNGVVKLTRPLKQLKIPPTVQAILAARIDRLTPDQKDLLQTLAVIGTEFKLGLVRKVAAKPGPELEPILSELQLGEFIYEQPASGDIEYIFKHALTHDVAYQSVLNERRRMLHGRIGAALESTYADSLDDHIAELAHHYSRSGNPAKGVEYCLRAVRQSVDRGSFVEAVAQLETGLEQLQKLPDDDRRAELELDLRNAAFDSLMAIKGFGSPEAVESTERALELSRRPGIDWLKTGAALYGAFFVRLTRPDIREARELATELVAIAERHGNNVQIAQSLWALAQVSLYAGAFELADRGFDRAWALLESKPELSAGFRQQVIEAANRIFSGWNLWLLGYPDRAVELIAIATALARESGSKNALFLVHLFAARIYELRREPKRMREQAEAYLALETDSGRITNIAICGIYLGWGDAIEGDLDGGTARMKHNLTEMRATGSEILNDYFLALIATPQGRQRRFDEALRTIDEAFPLIERGGQRMYEAEVHRLKGELLLMQDASNAAQAEQSFRTAIDISRRQKAKSWELRATTSLARLLDKQGHRDKARAMLAEIYNWFTEGFDTADLKDAKALLAELSG